MKRHFKISLVSIVIFGVVLSLFGLALVSQAKPEPMARKIVVFQDDFVNKAAQQVLIERFGTDLGELELINGRVVLLPARAVSGLLQKTEVKRIDDDVVVEALAKPTPTQPAETLPWGVDKIDADLVWATTTGDPIKVAIIDTGVDVKHPDLVDNLKGGVSTVRYTTSYNDDNGHGTHVAGIVGALDNTIGVIGVGPKIDLYAVKVLDRNGSGYLSDVIKGLNWVITRKATQGGDWIINMSLGTPFYNESFEDAVKRVNAAGITQVAAAGNSGPDDNTVIYPAKFAKVIAVSATDQTDNLASWSSRGPEVDLSAPGVSIYSTYKGQTYKTLSGTSMAAPHVTGAAALVLDKKTCGTCTPAEVQQRLEATAEQVVPDTIPGKDNFYGSGLVDAEKAVVQ